MNKINFVNNSEPALSAENLNQMQDNIDNAKIEKSTVLSQVDINTIEDTSYYYCNNCIHTPAENGYLFTQALSNDYIYQTFTNVALSGIYTRIKYDGVWQEWNLINTPLQVIDMSTILSNGWVSNGVAEVFKKDDIVHINASIRYGTSTVVGRLPEGYRPMLTQLIPATNGSASGFVIITNSGEITVSENILVSGSSNLMFNCTFRTV